MYNIAATAGPENEPIASNKLITPFILPASFSPNVAMVIILYKANIPPQLKAVRPIAQKIKSLSNNA